jgi:hypothetical protein
LILNYNQNKTMKKLGFLFLLWCSVFQLFGQSRKYYKQIINYTFDSTVTFVKGTPGYIHLKSASGKHIQQAYNYSTNKVYKHITYKNEELNVMHGPLFWFDDQGNLYKKGQYVNGFRAGVWREKHFLGGYMEGPYVNDKKDGPWSYYDSAGIKLREHYYDKGAISKIIFFNPDGTEKDTTASSQTAASFPCSDAFESYYSKCADMSLQVFIRENFKYPDEINEIGGIQGTAYFDLTIDVDGSITDIHIINGVCDELEKESIRLIKIMPKWEPGTVSGDPIKSLFTLPFRFRL